MERGASKDSDGGKRTSDGGGVKSLSDAEWNAKTGLGEARAFLERLRSGDNPKMQIEAMINAYLELFVARSKDNVAYRQVARRLFSATDERIKLSEVTKACLANVDKIKSDGGDVESDSTVVPGLFDESDEDFAQKNARALSCLKALAELDFGIENLQNARGLDAVKYEIFFNEIERGSNLEGESLKQFYDRQILELARRQGRAAEKLSMIWEVLEEQGANSSRLFNKSEADKFTALRARRILGGDENEALADYDQAADAALWGEESSLVRARQSLMQMRRNYDAYRCFILDMTAFAMDLKSAAERSARFRGVLAQAFYETQTRGWTGHHEKIALLDVIRRCKESAAEVFEEYNLSLFEKIIKAFVPEPADGADEEREARIREIAETIQQDKRLIITKQDEGISMAMKEEVLLCAERIVDIDGESENQRDDRLLLGAMINRVYSLGI